MEMTDALAALAALGQETRLDVFRLLVQAGPRGLPAGEIAQRLGVVQNTMSSHLAILSRAGLVKASREGRIIRYAADYAGMRSLLAFLMLDCCRGDPKFCAPLTETATCD
jgi:DNA-binding transcriptional ArsR family regulator